MLAYRPFGKLYVDGNVVEGNEKVTADNWDGGVQFPKTGGAANELSEQEDTADEATKELIKQVKLDKPLPMAPVTIQPAKEAFQSVLDNGGATLPKRDPVDERIVKE